MGPQFLGFEVDYTSNVPNDPSFLEHVDLPLEDFILLLGSDSWVEGCNS
jgi:hypothetical protein